VFSASTEGRSKQDDQSDFRSRSVRNEVREQRRSGAHRIPKWHRRSGGEIAIANEEAHREVKATAFGSNKLSGKRKAFG